MCFRAHNSIHGHGLLPQLAAIGCTTTLRGALPTAMVRVLPLARSTMVKSLEPSFVTYAVFPSADIVAQCGCLPTATLRTGMFVVGSNKRSSPGPCTTTIPNVALRG